MCKTKTSECKRMCNNFFSHFQWNSELEMSRNAHRPYNEINFISFSAHGYYILYTYMLSMR